MRYNVWTVMDVQAPLPHTLSHTRTSVIHGMAWRADMQTFAHMPSSSSVMHGMTRLAVQSFKRNICKCVAFGLKGSTCRRAGVGLVELLEAFLGRKLHLSHAPRTLQ